jgi:hypothetical protein
MEEILIDFEGYRDVYVIAADGGRGLFTKEGENDMQNVHIKDQFRYFK